MNILLRGKFHFYFTSVILDSGDINQNVTHLCQKIDTSFYFRWSLWIEGIGFNAEWIEELLAFFNRIDDWMKLDLVYNTKLNWTKGPENPMNL